MEKANTVAWTGPVVAQLVIAATTPLAVVLLGWYVTRAAKKLENIQWANQSVVSRRLDVFESIAPKLNLLLCFFTFVGGWKEVTPQRAIELKRQIDEAVYARRILFSEEMLRAYHRLMTTMFVMYAKADGDALLRARGSSELGAWRSAPPFVVERRSRGTPRE